MSVAKLLVTLHAQSPSVRINEPVTCGIPFPKGMLRHATLLLLRDAMGNEQRMQVRVLDQWSDGSARWVLCDWQATVNAATHYEIVLMPASVPATTAVQGLVVCAPSQDVLPELLVEDEDSRRYEAVGDGDETIEDGPLRTCVTERGFLSVDGRHLATYICRKHSFADSSVVRYHLTINNINAAEHPGGLWDLGNGGSIYLRDVSVRIPLPDATNGVLSAEAGMKVAFTGDVELYQDSSGGENWKSTNHISRTRQIPVQFRGYRIRTANDKRSGWRATPIITLQSDKEVLSVAIPYFWQNFPKALSADESGITLSLFPRQSSDAHEMQGGEQKTHVFYVAYGKDTISDDGLAWTREPIRVVVDPEWIAKSQAIPYLTSKDSDPHDVYLQLVNAAIEGDDTFEKKREVIDEYGWRHFGDIYGDHEAILHDEVGPKPRISHYNNQYDCVAGFGYQWLRSGDVRWFKQMDELAHHVRDIDLYNTDADKAAYNRGLFWHTYHYVDADTGTHRSYPKNGRVPPKNRPVPGGGPGNEQNYAHGLMLHYFLTGDENSREAALGMANWVLNMDDGNQTVFRWLSRGATGLASASRSPDYHGPGRGSANSVLVLLDGHRLTHEEKFLKKAEELIRRVIHPTDDVGRIVGMVHNGVQCVDAENRWFYVMFLKSLGRYLDYKAECNELDSASAYARASLLHYARWMAQFEYPYLSRPELLEYPTETWAAQDMWKSDVFKFAALHATGAERERFLERAKYFFEGSVNTLQPMPTKTLCRPVVLLMNHGWMQSWFAQHPDETRPAPKVENVDFGKPTVFVPQKTIALKRAKKLLVAGVVSGFALIVTLVGWLLT
jgi:hypothetical protein